MEVMPDYGSRVVRFSAFEVDLRAGELRRNGVKVKLQNQPFQILSMLLERPGEIIARDEMCARLWPAETFVDFDHGLNSAIRRLRDALGDSAESPTFVETLGRRGYRFIFPVEWPTGDTGNGNSNPGLAVVVPISITAPPDPLSRATSSISRPWKLKAAIALAALAATVLLVSLFARNDLRSGTRLGMLAPRTVLGHSATPQPAVLGRRLTANPEDTPVTSAVISPDGKYLAFTDRTGFYLRQVEGGETHAIPLPKGFEPLAESWFPDSVHLVVSWLGANGKPPSLWEISVMGGTPRKLADDASSARVSPDGSRIAFLRGRIESGEIWLIQADGSHPQRIAGSAESQLDDGFSPVAWAPEGNRIAYVRTTAQYYRRDETKVEIADVTTREIRVVISRPGLGQVLSWPHDKQLIYTLEEQKPNQNDFNLWSFYLDSRPGSALGPGTRVTSDRGEIAELSLTRDGKFLAVRRRVPQPDVYLAELRDGRKRLSTPQRLTLDERKDYPYSWTPDSKTIIFASDRDGPWHIFKQTIDQTQPELMVGGADDLGIPRLNPDNTELLYLVIPKREELSHTVRIMRVPLSGGQPKFVLEGPWIWNQQCARLPSTLCIYTPSEPNQQRFFSFDPVTGASAEISVAKITGIKGEGFVSWSLSPDGKYLATAERGRYKQPSIRILSMLDDMQKVVLVQGWAEIGGVDWAADGKSLWVGASRNIATLGRSNASALLRIDLDGKIETVSENGPVRFKAAIPSPDGHRLAFLSAATDASNVWLLENF